MNDIIQSVRESFRAYADATGSHPVQMVLGSRAYERLIDAVRQEVPDWLTIPFDESISIDGVQVCCDGYIDDDATETPPLITRLYEAIEYLRRCGMQSGSVNFDPVAYDQLSDQVREFAARQSKYVNLELIDPFEINGVEIFRGVAQGEQCEADT